MSSLLTLDDGLVGPPARGVPGRSIYGNAASEALAIGISGDTGSARQILLVQKPQGIEDDEISALDIGLLTTGTSYSLPWDAYGAYTIRLMVDTGAGLTQTDEVNFIVEDPTEQGRIPDKAHRSTLDFDGSGLGLIYAHNHDQAAVRRSLHHALTFGFNELSGRPAIEQMFPGAITQIWVQEGTPPTLQFWNGVTNKDLTQSGGHTLVDNTTPVSPVRTKLKVDGSLLHFADDGVDSSVLTAPGLVPSTRTVSAGTGLSGGGALSSNQSLSMPNVGPGAVGPIAYASVSTDAQGRVTALAAGATPALATRVVYKNLKVDYGAKGDTRRKGDGACSTGANTKITSATLAFTSADVGKVIRLHGAGAAGVRYYGAITAIDSATQVTVSPAISTTVSGQEIEVGTDDTAAIQAFFDALAVGGGLGEVPPGTYWIRSAVNQNNQGTNGTSYDVFGHGSASVFLFDLADTSTDAITLNQTGSDAIRTSIYGVSFRSAFDSAGTKTGQLGCRNGLVLIGGQHGQFTVEQCNFVSVAAGRAPLFSNGGVAEVRKTQFISCLAGLTSGASHAHVHCVGSVGVVVDSCSFNDVGQINGVSVGGAYGGYWILFDAPGSQAYGGGTLPASTHYNVFNSHFDEAIIYAIFAYPLSGNQGRHLVVDGCRIHMSSTGGAAGIYCTSYDDVEVRDTWIGYAVSGTQDALHLTTCKRVRVERVGFWNHATQITAAADIECLEVIECTGYTINTSATPAVVIEQAQGVRTVSVPAIAAGSTVNQAWKNPTAATVGAQVQRSPVLMLEGQGWDTDDAVARICQWQEQARPIAGATVTSKRFWAAKVGAGSMTDVMDLDSNGNLHLLNGLWVDGATGPNNNDGVYLNNPTVADSTTRTRSPGDVRWHGSSKIASAVHDQVWWCRLLGDGAGSDSGQPASGYFEIGYNLDAGGDTAHLRMSSTGFAVFGLAPASRPAAWTISGSAQAASNTIGAAATGTDTASGHGFASTAEFNAFLAAFQSLQGNVRQLQAENASFGWSQ